MRPRLSSLAAALGLTLLSSPARAITEPNGAVIPIDSNNGEVQLYSLFANLNEPINWLSDAGTSPNTFSPLCGFSATYVLNEAGSHFGLSWYNVGDAGNLHPLIAPNAPVGTTAAGADIKNDPAYAGGFVGFALVGGQTHYADPSQNVVCSGCNPQAPWISTVIYASKNTPNAYYLAFEDGGFGPNAGDFANDGDFNDDVYFVTGIICSGGGQPCDTGKPGVCGPGISKCKSGGGTECVGQIMASPTETCNGLDDDCNGQTDEGDICPMDFICDHGTCVEKCDGGEFSCPPGLACNPAGYCVDPLCAAVECPSGQVCVNGLCNGPCLGVQCPFGQTCLSGTCVDLCAGVMCDPSDVCTQGVCITRCDCAPCGPGHECNAMSGSCVDSGCGNINCPAGQHCKAGACVDNCDGVACPANQVCVMGNCTPMSGTGAGGSTGTFASGVGGDGGNMGPSGTGGAGGTSTTGEGGAGGGGAVSGKGGCGCRVGEQGPGPWGLAAGIALAALLAGRRRAR
ncbi:MAG: MYXO-CTERM sorting domain-containing protein [Byssovorax sp.]